MTEKDKREAAIRKAAREICRPLSAQLNRATDQIKAMADKLYRAELENMRLREELLKAKKQIMRP